MKLFSVRSLIWCLLFSSFVGATSFAGSADEIAANLEDKYLSYQQETDELDFEVLDKRSGSLSFNLPLFKVPGNKNWDIDVMFSLGRDRNNGIIEAPRLSGQGWLECHDNNERKELKLFLPGKTPIRFFKNIGSPYKGDWASVQGWLIKCIPTTNAYPSVQYKIPEAGLLHDYSGNSWYQTFYHTIPVGTLADYLVQSPTGQKYYFKRKPIVVENLVGTPFPIHELVPNDSNGYGKKGDGAIFYFPQHADFWASQMEDEFGNWIKYEYESPKVLESTTRSPVMLKSIVRNDGARVDIQNNFIKKTLIGAGGPYQVSYFVISSVSTNSKSWTFRESAAQGRYDLIQRPDGKGWEFAINDFAPAVIAKPGFGSTYHLSQVRFPNGKTMTYDYMRLCPEYLDGGTYFYTSRCYANGFGSYLALKARQITGPGLDQPVTADYSYFVPNFNVALAQQSFTPPSPERPPNGESFSYTFEVTAEKFKVFKFARDPYNGYLTKPLNISTGLLLEQSVFPRPPEGTNFPTVPLSPLPTIPPSIAMTNLKQNYELGQSISLEFSAGGGLPIGVANCKLDTGAWSVCTSGSTFVLPGTLTRGPHSVSIRVMDITGGYSTEQVVSFWVGEPQGPGAPILAANLPDYKVLPGKSVNLTAQFAGRITHYKWRKDGVIISGATSPNYYISAVEPKHFGSYQVTAYNNLAAVSSREANLSIDPALLNAIISVILE